MTELPALLSDLGDRVRQRFEAERRVLAFDQFLELVGRAPHRSTRDAARYLMGCIDHFGRYEVQRPWGTATRYRVFDGELGHDLDKQGREQLIGQEEVQEAFHRALQAFGREGRVNRLVLLHGPNGSAKSTFAACLGRALEAYSHTDDGAIYRFSWVFPTGRDGKGIGFGGLENPRVESYAHLPEDRIQVKIASEVREHPLLVLPREERRPLLERLFTEAGEKEPVSEHLLTGELSAKNKAIFEALLNAYRGDLPRVLAHVQVERWYISRRYRKGFVTIGPQMAVDASERQVTADRSLANLPASLSALTLFEPFGELVDGAGGMVEYSDLLKRPLDAWKYLLLATETSEVPLQTSTLSLNTVLLASSNELHLAAFREHPDYASFRGRTILVRMPYLTDYRREQAIYDTQIVPQARVHVAPHTTFVAAYFAVLSRLRPPRRDHYTDSTLGRLAVQLTPEEKAELLSSGAIPTRFPEDEAKVLRTGLREIAFEHMRRTPYEGQTGASPREIRAVLLDAAADAERGAVTPLAVLDGLALLCQRDDFEFAKQKVDSGYFDHRGFVDVAKKAWLDRVDDELRVASGLVAAGRTEDLLERYVTHVSQAVKGERVLNTVTGRHDEPDADLMARVEAQLGVRNAVDFRRDIMGRIASYAIDHPGDRIEHARVFADLLRELEAAWFRQHRKQVEQILRDALTLLDGGEVSPPERKAQARGTLDRFRTDLGYIDASAKVALFALLESRYTGG